MGFNEVALGAVGYVLELKRPLAKALLLPFVFYLVIEIVAEFELNLTAYVFLTILSVLVQTIFAITTHRMILLGPQFVPEWGQLSWSRRETFFALHVVGLGLVLASVCLLWFIPVVGWILAIGLTIWLAARLSLVFPAIAINHGVTFGLSWKLTKNYQLLMMGVVIVFPLLFLIPIALFGLIPYTLLLTNFLEVFATVFMVAALSVAYKVIYGEFYEGTPAMGAE